MTASGAIMYQPTQSDLAHEGAYLANGLKAIGKGKDNRYRLFQFTDCKHQQEAQIGNAIRSPVRCHTCQDHKLSSEAADVGLDLLKKVNKDRAIYRFNTCGHEQDIMCSNVRKGIRFFKCQTCHDIKINSESIASGLEMLEKIDSSYGSYRFKKCGHTQSIRFEAVRDKRFVCQQCEQTWANMPSNLYLHLIEYGTTTLLKFGRARNVEKRAVKYGLPVGTVLKILQVWPTSTGLDADRIETIVAKQFKRYNKTKAKLVLQDSGWTECYKIEDQQAIMDFVEKQVIQSTYTQPQIGLH
jgi:hypothetical protein